MVEFCYFSISVLHICSYLNGINCPGWLVELCDFSTSVYCTFVSNCEGVNCPGWLVELWDFLPVYCTFVAHCLACINMADQLSFVFLLLVCCTFVVHYTFSHCTGRLAELCYFSTSVQRSWSWMDSVIAFRHFAMAYRLSFFSTGLLAVQNL
jgi:hypothetical protein